MQSAKYSGSTKTILHLSYADFSIFYYSTSNLITSIAILAPSRKAICENSSSHICILRFLWYTKSIDKLEFAEGMCSVKAYMKMRNQKTYMVEDYDGKEKI